MPRLAVLCAVAVSLCGLAAGELLGQFRAAPRARPLVFHDLVYLGDEALHKELNLSAEQAKKIAEFRQQRLATFASATASRTRASSRRVQELTSAAEQLLADTLDAKQRQRLRQVVLQQLARDGFRQAPAAALADLKLTAEQRNALAAPGARLAAVLNKEQMQTWTKMSGAPFGRALVAQLPAGRGGPGRDDRGSRWASPVPVPPAMRLLGLAEARQELALTAEQQKQLDDARARWREAVSDYLSWTAAERQARLGKANAAYEQAVAAVLKEKQAERLEQVLMQQEVRGNDLALFSNSRAVKRLGLSPEQQKKRDDILTAQRDKLARLLLTGEGPARLRQKAADLAKETRRQLEGVLTEDQQAKLKGLLGPAFVEPGRGRGQGDRGPGRGFQAPSLFTREMAYLGAPEFAVELKLTGEQARKAAEVYQSYRQEATGRFGDFMTPARRQELENRYEKGLTTVLGGERRKRFRQMVLQVIEKQPARSTGVWALPEVSGELKLSAAQGQQLARGVPAEKVLSEEQHRRWKEMKGEPFKGTLTLPATPLGRGTRGPGRWGPGTRAPVLPAQFRYLEQKSVQTELKLTAQQVAEIKQLQTKWSEATRGHASWTADERPARLAKATEALNDVVKKLLQPAQAKRFNQVLLQNLSRSFAFGDRPASISVAPPLPFRSRAQAEPGLALLLLYPPAAKSLELTDRQSKQAAAIVAEAQAVTTLVRVELNRFGAAAELVTKTQAAHREQTEKKLRELLTEKQREAVKELLGEPFKGTFTAPTWGRGRGPAEP